MIEIALIPILAVLALAGLCLFTLNRRGAKVTVVKADVEQKAARVLEGDKENDQDFVNNVAAGMPIDECLAQHADVRHKLFPGSHLRATHWTTQDLDEWKKHFTTERTEQVNRSLTVPAFGTALVIIAASVVAVVVLYSFRSSTVPELAQEPPPQQSFSQSPLPPESSLPPAAPPADGTVSSSSSQSFPEMATSPSAAETQPPTLTPLDNGKADASRKEAAPTDSDTDASK